MPSNHDPPSPPPDPEILARRPPTPGIRQRLFDATYEATKKGPFPWQLDVAEALCDRRDVMCIAGTGKGKTLAFVMPYFVDPRALIWIVSPLNYIQQQQVRQFRDEWNIPTCSVNATTSYPGLHKDILNGKFRVIITSPERLLEHNKLRPIIIQLGAQNWNNIVIVDECHCICIWSDQFRKMYGVLGTLRIFLLPGTPFCAATATATESMQNQIRASLRFRDDYLFINEGYWKPNLSWHVHYMRGSGSSIKEITYAFPRDLTPASHLPMTIIFVDQRGLAFDILQTLLDYLPAELAGKVEVYHALQSQRTKDLIALRFERGELFILISTEALTMGCDFRKIAQVILFKVPATLPTVLQRGGRGGRDANIWCRVVLMVEASKHKAAAAKIAGTATQLKRIKQEESIEDEILQPNEIIGIDEVAALESSNRAEPNDEDEGTRDAIRVVSAEHGKEDDALLRLFYEPSDRCRTLVLDKAFCSPPHAPCITVNGCDNCIRQRIKELETKPSESTHQELPHVKLEPIDDDGTILDDSEPILDPIPELRKLLIEPRHENKLPMKERAKYRPTDERGILEESLAMWRQSVYQSECKGLGIHADHIITDKTITAIVRIPPPVTLASLSGITPSWPKSSCLRWGPSLLSVIHKFDSPARMDERKAERAQIRKDARLLQGTRKKDPVKPEKDLSGRSSLKRRLEASGSASPGAAKRQQTKVEQVANAESAASAEAMAPETSSTIPTTPERTPPQDTTPAHPSQFIAVLPVSHLSSNSFIPSC
ncbi:putative ATP-dependent DNA helicase RecQ [Bacillus subtilis subsp, subtilis str. 168] [Rhizoctonia solani]|uniref:DNA 3'-5' helicase n=1 Tax=Rhizoctonia solani TaxID=456999 RepID=A0A0K6FQQ3_9AGAM|nr:putative ATP-dependent DNA helicase RecQ [Bacillus subtilis subsp, subtilis str. 168] [Rhizoctonia solani]